MLVLSMTVAYHSYIRFVSSEQKNVFCFFFFNANFMPAIPTLGEPNKVSVFKELPFFFSFSGHAFSDPVWV